MGEKHEQAKKERRESRINRIQDEFDNIQYESNLPVQDGGSNSNSDFDVQKYLAKKEDLPDLGDIQLYDYDSDMEKSTEKAMDVLESLVDLYLGDNEKVSEHPYIKNKMREDAQIYAETIFLQKMTRKNFLAQLRQIDNGDSSARMHEVVNQTIREVRENVKFTSTQRTELEKFYKEIRKDLGLSDVSETIDTTPTNVEEEEDGMIMDSRSMNDMIDKYLKNK